MLNPTPKTIAPETDFLIKLRRELFSCFFIMQFKHCNNIKYYGAKNSKPTIVITLGG